MAKAKSSNVFHTLSTPAGWQSQKCVNNVWFNKSNVNVLMYDLCTVWHCVPPKLHLYINVFVTCECFVFGKGWAVNKFVILYIYLYSAHTCMSVCLCEFKERSNLKRHLILFSPFFVCMLWTNISTQLSMVVIDVQYAHVRLHLHMLMWLLDSICFNTSAARCDQRTWTCGLQCALIVFNRIR